MNQNERMAYKNLSHIRMEPYVINIYGIFKYLDLLKMLVQKMQTYSPKWWFNGDLPWNKKNTHKKKQIQEYRLKPWGGEHKERTGGAPPKWSFISLPCDFWC